MSKLDYKAKIKKSDLFITDYIKQKYIDVL